MTDLMHSMMTEDEFLEHSGVKGMKWGKRKAAPSTTHVSADAARYNKIDTRVKKNGLDNLSNDDLAKLNKRKQLLTEYKKNNPSTLKKGELATQKTIKGLKAAGVLITVAAGLSAAAKSDTLKAGTLAVAKVLKSLK